MNITIKIFVLALALNSCQNPTSNTEDQTSNIDHQTSSEVELTQAQYDQANIKVGKAEMRTIGSELNVNGVIDVPPQSNISITLPYGGFLKYTEMLPGTKVKKGQLLAVIENPDFIQFQQDYLEGLANQEFLKAEFERQENLYSENVASGKAFQQAKSSYQANEARIKTMEARLKLIGFNPGQVSSDREVSTSVNIYSPVSGSVREVYTNVGKYINPQDVIMDITNAEDLHVELTVYENDITRVKEGQRIRFTLTNAPGEVKEAEVFLVGSGVREDRSVTVHGHLKQMDADLMPGMYVSARVETGTNEVWAVPEEAVVRFGGEQYVFAYCGQREENGTAMQDFQMLQVVKGITEDGYTQISMTDSSDISALPIITEGAFTLLAKSKNSEGEGGGHGH